MKNMRFQSNTIKQLAPVIAALGRNLAGNFSSARFQVTQKRDNRLGDWDGESHFGSSFGIGKGDCAAYQIHPIQRDTSFTDTATSSEANFKAYSHPFWDEFMAQRSSYGRNLRGSKGGVNPKSGGRADGVVVKGSSIQLSKQTPLAVNPFHKLNISKGAVSVDAVAGAMSVGVGGAPVSGTPGDVQLGLAGAEVLQVDLVLGHEHLEPVPAIAVVGYSKRAGGPIMDMVQNPIVASKAALFLYYGYLGRLSECLGSVKLGIQSVLSRLTLPLSIRTLISNRVAIRSASFVDRRHVATVAYASLP